MDITAGPYGANAVTANDTSTIKFGTNGKVAISDDIQSAVSASGAGSTITFGNNADLSAIGNGIKTVQTRGDNSEIIIGDNAKISATLANGIVNPITPVYAVYAAAKDTTITIGKSADISVSASPTGSKNLGSAVYTTSEGSGSVIDIDDGAKISATGYSMHTVEARATDSTISIGKNSTITASGNTTTGLMSWGKDTTITLGDSSKISVSGDQTYGAYSGANESASINAKIELGDDVEVTVTGNSAKGVAAAYGTNSQMIVGDSAKITVTGANATGASASMGALTSIGDFLTASASGFGSNGIGTSDNGRIEVGLSADISASGQDASAVRIQSGGLAEIDKWANISATGQNAKGVLAEGKDDLGSGEKSKVIIAENATIGVTETANGTYSAAVIATKDAEIEIGSKALIKAAGNSASGVRADTLYFEGGTSATVSLSEDVRVETTGNNGYGLYARAAGSKIDAAEGLQIETSGVGASGMFAYWGGNIEIKDRANIETTGSQAHGMNVTYGASVKTGKSLDITTSGDGAHGLQVWSGAVYATSSADIGDNASITTSGSAAHGAYATDNAVIGFKNDATIVTRGTGAYGAYAYYNASVLLSDDATVLTSGDSSHGLYAGWQGNITLGDEALVQTTGKTAHGVYAEYGTSGVTIGSSADILTTGAGSHAVYTNNMNNNYGPLEITIDKNAKIATAGSASHAVYALGGEITIGENAAVSTVENESYGLYANKGSISVSDDLLLSTKGNGSIGVYAWFGGQVDIGNSASISTEGTNSYGVFAQHLSGDVRIGDDLTVRTTGESAHGLVASSQATFEGSTLTVGDSADVRVSGSKAAAAYAELGGSVTIGENAYLEASGAEASTVGAIDDQSKVTVGNGATILATSNDSYAVSAIYNGEVELLGDMAIASLYDQDAIALFANGRNASNDVNARNASIHANGKLDILGGIVAGDYSSIDLTYLDGSSLVGFTQVSANDSTIAMDMSASTWDMTKSSSLTSLTVNDGTQVKYGDFDNPAGGNFMTLTTKTLSGNDGRFLMRTDIVNETADRIIVENASSGSHAITVVNIGGAATTGKERTTLVETADKGADFTLTNGAVDLGAWTYWLRNNDDGRGQFDGTGGQHWELYALGGGSTPDDSSNPGSDAVNTFIGSYYLGYADTDTLMKRVGDLRNNTYQHGAWFRAYGGKFESDARQYVKDFDQDYWAVQVGYDNKLDRNRSWFKKGDTYVGAYIGLGNSDLDFTSGGSGEIEQHTMGMYWTYIGDSGFYFDAVAKYVWGENKFHSFDSAKDFVDGGEINSSGAGLSFETGKRFRFNKNDKGNWYVEPQLQLSWQHMSGGTFHASNGLNIGVSGWDSLIGRAGVLLGYETGRTNFYAKASYLKEFDGDMNIHANGVNISESLEDKWWVYGIGLTHQLNARNALYLDFERASGGDFTQKWQINAGWRISF
ncbi:autotransporter outer membrane beta-barrel domain-containing protein [Synergistaceae bacterium OttesenSCG-928-D05]|nr:autotransporter outer membrane beta-barrel domain-containing protein [Synergistaceae bacterium OttesenSCG-928-D05]